MSHGICLSFVWILFMEGLMLLSLCSVAELGGSVKPEGEWWKGTMLLQMLMKIFLTLKKSCTFSVSVWPYWMGEQRGAYWAGSLTLTGRHSCYFPRVECFSLFVMVIFLFHDILASRRIQVSVSSVTSRTRSTYFKNGCTSSRQLNKDQRNLSHITVSEQFEESGAKKSRI